MLMVLPKLILLAVGQIIIIVDRTANGGSNTGNGGIDNRRGSGKSGIIVVRYQT